MATGRRTNAVVLIGLTIVFGLSRLAAVARSLWDWDEALFSLAVLDYDVAVHRPHPPGYPLFIGAAKLLHALGMHEFRALQAIVVVAAMTLFPVACFAAKEIGFRFHVAVGGAALLVVLPNVWLYGGTAFSDVPGLVLLLLASALLLKGRRDRWAFIAGAATLGIAIGMRSAALLVGVVPLSIAAWQRFREIPRERTALRREALTLGAALVLLAAIVVASYGGAAMASESVASYRWALDEQSAWVRTVDSYRNPTRPSLTELWKLFFVLPVQDKDLMFPIAALAALGAVQILVRRRTAALLTIAMFAPLMVFSLLMLDLNAVSRYALGYLPMHAFLAAEGLDFIAEPFGRWRRRAPSIVYGAVATAGVLAIALWVWPSLKVQRRKISPPVAAIEWVRRNALPSAAIHVSRAFEPHARYLLAGRAHDVFDDRRSVANAPAHAFVVDHVAVPGAKNFIREKGRLWKTVRARGFEASVFSMSNRFRFGGGWYSAEWEGDRRFRWMTREGVIYLPAVEGPSMLRLGFSIHDAAPKPVVVDVLFNGKPIERVEVSGHATTRTWTLASSGGEENELRLIVEKAFTPAAAGVGRDPRQLGVRLEGIEWMPRRP